MAGRDAESPAGESPAGGGCGVAPSSSEGPVAGREGAGRRADSRAGMYVWTAVVLAVCVTAVILGWHARGGTPDPTDPGNHIERHERGDQQRRARLPRGSGDDSGARRDHGELPGRQPRVPQARGARWRARAAGVGRDVVPGGVVHRHVRRRRPGRAGRDRHPGDHRAAGGDELVLPQALLDRLDLTPPSAAAAGCWARRARSGRARRCSGWACSASRRCTARVSRS